VGRRVSGLPQIKSGNPSAKNPEKIGWEGDEVFFEKARKRSSKHVDAKRS
jgi:hypothetical protein